MFTTQNSEGADNGNRSFFDALPAELRIRVYRGLVKTAYEPILWDDCGIYYKTLAVSPSVLATSQQMKDEVEHELKLMRMQDDDSLVILCNLDHLSEGHERYAYGPFKIVHRALNFALHHPDMPLVHILSHFSAHRLGKVIINHGDQRPTYQDFEGSAVSNFRAFLEEVLPKVRKQKKLELRILNHGGGYDKTLRSIMNNVPAFSNPHHEHRSSCNLSRLGELINFTAYGQVGGSAVRNRMRAGN